MVQHNAQAISGDADIGNLPHVMLHGRVVGDGGATVRVSLDDDQARWLVWQHKIRAAYASFGASYR